MADGWAALRSERGGAGAALPGLDSRRARGVQEGTPASYIPELAGVDPSGFGLSLSSSDGHVYESGNADRLFTMQSISKPFTYALALG